MRLFISYTGEDRRVVEEYVNRLQDEPGIDLFWDKNISPGDDFLSVLARQATGVETLIVFVSKNSLASKFVRREVLWADSRDGVQIIPIFIDNPASAASADPGLLFFLRERQAILAYESDFETSYQRLIQTLRPKVPEARPAAPVVSVMGTKGGVGKSSIIAALAELIASAGRNVMIIDADVETAGLGKYISARARSRPHVRSVLDIAYDKASETTSHQAAGTGAWNVTPKYLEDARFGDICLIPARLETDPRSGYDPIANLGPARRNEAALTIIDELIERARSFQPAIDCILIDSGAENNPLVSAAIVRATYGFIVSAPNPEFRGEIPRLEAIHRERYPQHALGAMHVIVNQATEETPDLWAGRGHVSFVREDPEMRRAAARGGVDFEGVGLNNFYLDVLRVLNTTFDDRDQRLLPNEGEVWVKPYLEAMKEFPEKVLARFQYRFLQLTSLAVLLVALGVAGFSAAKYLDNRRPTSELVTAVTVARPSTEPEAEFKSRLESFSAPEGFGGRVWVEGQNLNVKGVLSEEDVSRLKQEVRYGPVQDALVVAAFQSTNRSKTLKEEQAATRQTSVMFFIFAVILIVLEVLRARKLRDRKRFLQSIISARDSARQEELNELIRAMLAADGGKPQLRWLREEFRKHAPSLVSMIG